VFEITHNKIDIAIEQLENAIVLFLSEKSYVSALTLAGAAEETLGMAVKIKGIENSIQEQYRNYSREGYEWLYPPKTWAEFTTHGKNKVRNAIKHLSGVDDINFEADIEEEALWMLVRATDNYIRLGLPPTVLMHEFDGWFYENYIGI
jgi:hypothetical protein